MLDAIVLSLVMNVMPVDASLSSTLAPVSMVVVDGPKRPKVPGAGDPPKRPKVPGAGNPPKRPKVPGAGGGQGPKRPKVPGSRPGTGKGEPPSKKPGGGGRGGN